MVKATLVRSAHNLLHLNKLLQKAYGGLDWANVTAIEIIGVENPQRERWARPQHFNFILYITVFAAKKRNGQGLKVIKLRMSHSHS